MQGGPHAQPDEPLSLSPTADDIINMYCQQMNLMKEEYGKRLSELYATVSSSLEYVQTLQDIVPYNNTQLSSSRAPSGPSTEKSDGGVTPQGHIGSSISQHLLNVFRESLESEKELKIQVLMDDLARTKGIVNVMESKLCESMGTSQKLTRELDEHKKQLQNTSTYTHSIKKRAASLEAELNSLQPQINSLTHLQDKLIGLEKRSKAKQDDYKRQLSTLKADVSKLESENALLKHDQVNVFQLRNELNDLRLKYNVLYKEYQELQSTHSIAQYDLQAKTKTLTAMKSANTHHILKEKAASDSIKLAVDAELKDQRRLLSELVEQVRQQGSDLKKLSSTSPEEMGVALANILSKHQTNIDRLSVAALGSGQVYSGGTPFHGDPNYLYDYTGTPVTQQTHISIARHTEAMRALEDEIWHRAESKYKTLLFNAESDLQRRLSEARDEFYQKEIQLKRQVQEALSKGTDKVQDELSKLREECASLKTLCSHKDLEMDRLTHMLNAAQEDIARFQTANRDLLQSAESYRNSLEYYENLSKQSISARGLIKLCHDELKEIKRRVLDLKKTQFSPSDWREEQRVGDAELLFSAIAGDLKLTFSDGGLAQVLTPIGNMIKTSVEHIKQQTIRINDEKWMAQIHQMERDYGDQIAYIMNDNEKLKQTIIALRERMQVEMVKLLGVELTDMHDRCATQLDNLKYEAESMKTALDEFLKNRPHQLAEARLMSSPIAPGPASKGTPLTYKTQAVTPGLLIDATLPTFVTPGTVLEPATEGNGGTR